MKEIGEALPWVAFWAVIGLCVWVSHLQFVAGYDNWLFEHKTPEEKRLREAAIRRAERAQSTPQPPAPPTENP